MRYCLIWRADRSSNKQTSGDAVRTRLLWLACQNASAEGVFIGSALLQWFPLTLQSGYFNRFSSAQQVSSKLAGLCQPGPRDAAASSSMVCLLPGAVTFSCVRSMSCLLSSHHSECAPSSSIRIRMQTSHLNLNLRHCPNLRLHLYGVCEAWRGVLPSPAPAAHRRQVRRGGLLGPAAHTRSHRSVAHQGCWALHERVCLHSTDVLESPLNNPVVFFY